MTTTTVLISHDESGQKAQVQKIRRLQTSVLQHHRQAGPIISLCSQGGSHTVEQAQPETPGQDVSLISSLRETLSSEADVVWVHYAGPAQLAFAISQGRTAAALNLAPQGGGQFAAATLFKLAAMSPALRVVISFDLTGATLAVRQTLASEATAFLGTHCGLVADTTGETSRNGNTDFTSRLAKSFAVNAVPGNDLFSHLSSIADDSALIIPPALTPPIFYQSSVT